MHKTQTHDHCLIGTDIVRVEPVDWQGCCSPWTGDRNWTASLWCELLVDLGHLTTPIETQTNYWCCLKTVMGRKSVNPQCMRLTQNSLTRWVGISSKFTLGTCKHMYTKLHTCYELYTVVICIRLINYVSSREIENTLYCRCWNALPRQYTPYYPITMYWV